MVWKQIIKRLNNIRWLTFVYILIEYICICTTFKCAKGLEPLEIGRFIDKHVIIIEEFWKPTVYLWLSHDKMNNKY